MYYSLRRLEEALHLLRHRQLLVRAADAQPLEYYYNCIIVSTILLSLVLL